MSILRLTRLARIAGGKLAENLAVHAAQQLQGIPAAVMGMVRDKFMFSIRIDEDTEVYSAFEEWFYKHHEHKFKNVTVFNFTKTDSGKTRKLNEEDKYYNGSSSNTSDVGSSIGYSQNSGTHLIVVNGVRIHIHKGKEAKSEKDRSSQKAKEYYVISGVDKDGIKKFIEDIYSSYANANDQTKVYISNMHGHWDLVKRISGKTLDNIILPKEIHDSLTQDMKGFESEKEWYDSLNIPYKRGYLLYGPPGNGKTSLAIAMANEHKRNIYCLDINKLRDDTSLRLAFSQLQGNSLLLIEDIDATFKQREGQTEKKADGKRSNFGGPMITFACLLNCLDGVYYKDGLVTIMTTNFIDRLDKALIRPGRIDMKVFIDNPSITEVNTYLTKFYRKPIVLEGYDKQLPMAEIQGVCISNKDDSDKAIAELLSANFVSHYAITEEEMVDPIESVKEEFDEDEVDLLDDDDDLDEPSEGYQSSFGYERLY